MVQQWRESMLRLSRTRAKSSLTENDNDQSLFNQIVHGNDATSEFMRGLGAKLKAAGVSYTESDVSSRSRKVHRSHSPGRPCLPTENCNPAHFT